MAYLICCLVVYRPRICGFFGYLHTTCLHSLLPVSHKVVANFHQLINSFTSSPKLIPWFVSDVTPPDFRQAFTSLLDSSFFPVPVGDPSAPSSEHLIHMVTRWKKYMEQGVFNLSVPFDSSLGDRSPIAEFWTLPWPYWNMEHQAPELFETLQKSDLVIFKVPFSHSHEH